MITSKYAVTIRMYSDGHSQCGRMYIRHGKPVDLEKRDFDASNSYLNLGNGCISEICLCKPNAATYYKLLSGSEGITYKIWYAAVLTPHYGK